MPRKLNQISKVSAAWLVYVWVVFIMTLGLYVFWEGLYTCEGQPGTDWIRWPILGVPLLLVTGGCLRLFFHAGRDLLKWSRKIYRN